MGRVFKVLVIAPYMQPVIECFRSVFDENGIEVLVPPVSERLEEAELLQSVLTSLGCSFMTGQALMVDRGATAKH